MKVGKCQSQLIITDQNSNKTKIYKLTFVHQRDTSYHTVNRQDPSKTAEMMNGEVTSAAN